MHHTANDAGGEAASKWSSCRRLAYLNTSLLPSQPARFSRVSQYPPLYTQVASSADTIFSVPGCRANQHAGPTCKHAAPRPHSERPPPTSPSPAQRKKKPAGATDAPSRLRWPRARLAAPSPAASSRCSHQYTALPPAPRRRPAAPPQHRRRRVGPPPALPGKQHRRRTSTQGFILNPKP